MERLVSIAGIVFFVGVAWVFSRNRRMIPWRTVAIGIIMQVIIAVFLLRSSVGRSLFEKVNMLVVGVLSHARIGSEVIFGALAVPPGETGSSGEQPLGFFLLFQGFPVIIFVGCIMAMLYYAGIMPRIVEFFARIFSRIMRLSGAEAMVTVNNIFVGIESLIAIRPYIRGLTLSEMHLLLTAGMATIASSVLGFYSMILGREIPGIAGHLVSASILSAPAAVVMSKVMYPEKEKPATFGVGIHLDRNYMGPGETPPSSLMDAGVHGAMEGVKLIMGICAMLVAFLGLVSLLNAITGGAAAMVGIRGLSFDMILSWVFYPFAILSGVRPDDALAVAQLWGLRVMATEVPAYIQLSGRMKAGFDGRSAVIAAYGLCGFAHFASLAIFVGGASALAPERRRDLIRLSFSALVAANLACFQTAAVAGLCLAASGSVFWGQTLP